MFEPTTCNLLKGLTEYPPQNEARWNAPWFSIMAHLFPSSQGYIFVPVCETADKDRTPYLVYEVAKASDPPIRLRSVLIVVIMHNQVHGKNWRASIPLLETEMHRQTNDAFRKTYLGATAISKVYWIGVLGPHWRFGVKEDNGRELKPLIDWHDTTHDQASYDDFTKLTDHIKKM